MRIVFLGTPDFAVPTLDALAAEHEVALVVAQPDKPAGRGMKMQAPPVVVRARELELNIAQPAKVRDEAFLQQIEQLQPELGIVVAYGKILPKRLLDIPPRGFLNVHASVLPRWRGAAPIQRAIEAGDLTTGVTIMRVDEELDHGAMLAVETTEIGADERTPSLARRLAQIGGEALARVLRKWPPEVEQDHASATYAAKIDKSEGAVNWEQSAKQLYDRFRAFDPWPGLFTPELKLIDVRPADGNGAPGTILRVDDGVTVATRDGALRILVMQRPGKNRAAAGDVARAMSLRAGDRMP